MRGRRLIAAILGVLVVGAVLLRAGGMLVSRDEMSARNGCAYSRTVWLVAQSVPTGRYVPCILPDIDQRDMDVAVDSLGSSLEYVDLSGARWSLGYAAECDPWQADPVVLDLPPGVTAFESTVSSPDHHVTRYYVFEGGCVVSKIDAPYRVDIDLAVADAEAALALIERSEIDDAIGTLTGGSLHLDP